MMFQLPTLLMIQLPLLLMIQTPLLLVSPIITTANDPIFRTLGHVEESFPVILHSFIRNA